MFPDLGRPSNRTTLELKQKGLSEVLFEFAASNRTTLELKLDFSIEDLISKATSNRTTLELKRHFWQCHLNFVGSF